MYYAHCADLWFSWERDCSSVFTKDFWCNFAGDCVQCVVLEDVHSILSVIVWFVCVLLSRQHVEHRSNITGADNSCTRQSTMANVRGIHRCSNCEHYVRQQSDSNKEVWDWWWCVDLLFGHSLMPQYIELAWRFCRLTDFNRLSLVHRGQALIDLSTHPLG